jgi:hypothetical protein
MGFSCFQAEVFKERNSGFQKFIGLNGGKNCFVMTAAAAGKAS